MTMAGSQQMLPWYNLQCPFFTCIIIIVVIIVVVIV
jgi:hypothetical protein